MTLESSKLYRQRSAAHSFARLYTSAPLCSYRGVQKKRIMLIVVLLLIFGGILWFATHREVPIKVIGDLPAKDLAEIKSLVRHEMKREIFPFVSWRNVKGLPSAIWRFSTVQKTDVLTSDGKTVDIRVTTRQGTMYYRAQKGINKWQIIPFNGETYFP
ncbi:MAG: hypothetical protein JWQ71_3082 [Pedosphaera sp.]|nr:hypothetical protein [Pedosphaera sp.]